MATLCHTFCGCFPAVHCSTLYSRSHHQWESYPFVHTTIAGIYGCSIAFIPPTIWHWKRPLIQSQIHRNSQIFGGNQGPRHVPLDLREEFQDLIFIKGRATNRFNDASASGLILWPGKKTVGKSHGRARGRWLGFSLNSLKLEDSWLKWGFDVPGSWIIYWISGFGSSPENGTLINTNPGKKAKASQNDTFII